MLGLLLQLDKAQNNFLQIFREKAHDFSRVDESRQYKVIDKNKAKN